MLTLDLVRLDREGFVEFQGEIASDDSVWPEIEGAPQGGFEVEGRAQMTSTGQLVVRVSMQGVVEQGCRRCLDPVRTQVRENLDLVWAPEGSVDAGEDDGDLRILDAGVPDLDLLPALREECLLRIPAWVVCKETCLGLCPHCGIDLNEINCECSNRELDPRWDALRGLTSEERK